MASYNILFLFLLFCFLIFPTTQAQDDSIPVYIYYNCSGGGNTTNGSPFQTNVGELLSSLSSNALSDTGFYKTAVPRENSPDSVFGLFMCRGDVPLQLCQHCVQNATTRLSEECPLSKQAVIWYTECTVRYSNRSFFSTFDTRPRLGLLNIANISNQESFMRLLFNTINKTADEAANSIHGKKYATREANISEFQRLYCLAQCTPDLSPTNCRACLSRATGDLPWCCEGKQGGRGLYPSCNVRYELYPFYRTVAHNTDSQFPEDPTYLNHNCSTNNVTADTTFKKHLKTLLSYMSSNGTNPYKNKIDDIVYGLFMCRGDLPSPLCQQCVLNATNRIFSLCNSSQQAIIWYSHCMLRYSYKYFFSQMETTPSYQDLNVINTASPISDISILSNTLDNLAGVVADATSKYVAKSSKLNDDQILYTLAQCTQDLSGDDCSSCLQDINVKIPWFRLGSVGGRVLYPSCNFRFQLFPFYESGDDEGQRPTPGDGGQWPTSGKTTL